MQEHKWQESSTSTGQPAPRDLRIDFFRGLALIFIFWDHIPGNPFGHLTLRNIGFSDAAELFVFLAGYAAAIAYGRQLQRRGYFATALHILRRSWILYVAHVFLLTQLMALLLTVNDHVATRDFITEMGLQYFLDNPKQALVASTLLSFRPSLMDPLPLYIVLLLMLAAALPALIQRPRATLLLSAGLYIAALHNDWNFRAQPSGVWYFNPFAWQFLFFIGAALGAHRDAIAQQLARVNSQLRRRLLVGCSGLLAVTGVIALSWHWPEWHDSWMPQTLAQWLYPIDKTNLGVARLLHFLALTLVTALIVPQGSWLQQPLARATQLLGRHSLPVFCSGVMLAPLADAVNALAGDSFAIQTLTSLGGIALFWCLAQLLEWYRQDAGNRSPPHTLPVSSKTSVSDKVSASSNASAAAAVETPASDPPASGRFPSNT